MSRPRRSRERSGVDLGAEPKAMATCRDQGEAESVPVLTLEPSRRQWRPVATKAKPRASPRSRAAV
ncbi:MULTISPECIES: hypothetical protein [Paenibacillus]|uniref:hypothetical protein n=1 Tax=Paenibacillus TaxID=44249 RepID=UPI0011157BE8|nr:hypothetical protein [Paenibacillus amylolyticus]